MSQVAARLTSAVGEVIIERDGKSIEISVGDAIYSTDRIETLENSSAQIKFSDGAIASLSSNSELWIEDFVFEEGKDPSFILNLAEGAMRSLSGEIVKQNPDAFKIVTPNSTAGIRGTELLTAVKNNSELHIVIEIGTGHTVVITASDGRTITLTTSGQGVEAFNDGKPLERLDFSEQELKEVLENISELLALALVDETTGESIPLTNLDNLNSTILFLEANLLNALDTDHSATLHGILSDTGFTLTDGISNLDDGDGNNDDETLADFQKPSDSSDDDDDDDFPDELELPDGIVYLDNPAVDYFEVEKMPAKKVEFGNTTIQITNFLQNARIASDIMTMESGEGEGGDDSVIVIGDMQNGSISGDAYTISGGKFDAGDDTISLDSSKTGGNTLYGDAMSVSGVGTELNAGDDEISIIGTNVANQNIYGDIKEALDGANVVAGDDIIKLGINFGNIYGDVETITNATVSGGNDEIIVTTNNGNIYANAGNDEIQVTTNNGNIYGEDGNDKILITTNNGNIDAGLGVDELQITSSTGGTISMGADSEAENIEITSTASNTTINLQSSDTLILNEAQNGVIITGASGTANINTMNTGDISLNSSGINFTLNSMNGGTLNNNGINNIAVTTLQNGTINGANDADTINITNMNGGAINANGGNDSIKIEAYIAGAIDGGAGTDTLTINSDITSQFQLSSVINFESFAFNRVTTNGEIIGTTGNDIIDVPTVDESGIISANAGDDSIKVGNISQGAKINGEDGNDTIEITGTLSDFAGIDSGDGFDSIVVNNLDASPNAILIETGAGNDTIKITNYVGASINAGDDNDSIYIESFTGTSFQTPTIEGGNGSDTVSFGKLTAGQNLDLNFIAFRDVESVVFEEVSGGTISNIDSSTPFTINNFNSGTVNSTNSNDAFSINNFNGGNINLDDGIDTLTIINQITSSNNQTITNNNNNPTFTNDYIYLNNGIGAGGSLTLNAGTNLGFGLQANAAGDGFNMSGGVINASNGNDNIIIESFTGGTINTNDGLDEIIFTSQITNAHNITIVNSASSSDGINFNNGVAGGIINLNTGGANGFNLKKDPTGAGFVMSGGTINASDAVDIITIEGFSGGQINTGLGADNIRLGGNTFTGGITNTGGVDVINFTYITTISANLTLNSTTADGFTVRGANNTFGFNMNSGSITSNGIGNDNFLLTDLSGGSIISTASGNDTVTVNNLTNGTINTGDGVDSITVGYTSGTINTGDGSDIVILGQIATADNKVIMNSGTGIDTVYVELIDGALTLSAENFLADGFVIRKDATTGFDMYSGTLSTSSVADNILIANLLQGTISADSGNDTIIIESLGALGGQVTSILIDGGQGSDNITINADINGAPSTTPNSYDSYNVKVYGGDRSTLSTDADSITVNGYASNVAFKIDSQSYSGSTTRTITVTGEVINCLFQHGNAFDNILNTISIGQIKSGTTYFNVYKTTVNIAKMSGGMIDTVDNFSFGNDSTLNIADLSGGTIDTYTVNATITGISQIIALGFGVNASTIIDVNYKSGFQQFTNTISLKSFNTGTINGSANADIFLVQNYVTSVYGATINAGAGNDSIYLNTGSNYNSDLNIDLGEGQDYLYITDYSGIIKANDNEVDFISGDISDITLEIDANDYINITPRLTGDFDQIVNITGELSNGGIAGSSSSIYLASGDDSVSITGNMSGGTISLDAGNDTVKILADASSTGGNITSGTISVGNGDDATNTNIVEIAGNVTGGFTGAININGANGSDHITIGGNVTGIALNAVNITGGSSGIAAGNDVIHIKGNVTSSILSGVSISGNIGADSIIIDGSLNASAASAVSIDGGAGADSITINGSLSASAADAISILGGAGADSITLGDITNVFAGGVLLNLGSNAASADTSSDTINLKSSTVGSGALITISGFEVGTDVLNYWNGSAYELITVTDTTAGNNLDLGNILITWA